MPSLTKMAASLSSASHSAFPRRAALSQFKAQHGQAAMQLMQKYRNTSSKLILSRSCDWPPKIEYRVEGRDIHITANASSLEHSRRGAVESGSEALL